MGEGGGGQEKKTGIYPSAQREKRNGEKSYRRGIEKTVGKREGRSARVMSYESLGGADKIDQLRRTLKTKTEKGKSSWQMPLAKRKWEGEAGKRI